MRIFQKDTRSRLEEADVSQTSDRLILKNKTKQTSKDYLLQNNVILEINKGGMIGGKNHLQQPI